MALCNLVDVTVVEICSVRNAGIDVGDVRAGGVYLW